MSFKTHIAVAIWNNQEHEPLRCMSKTSTIREWNWWTNPNNSIFKGCIQMSGLKQFIRCSYRNVDKIVVYTFVERWHPETNTFHMPFNEMTITLDDVSSILGASPCFSSFNGNKVKIACIKFVVDNKLLKK
ncbi:unnamed protein product [Prunus armeniaca]